MITKLVTALADRYDPSASDPPLVARVRLAAGDEAHDALLDAGGVRIVPADGSQVDAMLSGSPAAWRRAAEGAGLAALGGGGLRLRHNLHVATGFLAGTAAERSFPAARHLELDCGHVPQIERPMETHDAIREFLR